MQKNTNDLDEKKVVKKSTARKDSVAKDISTSFDGYSCVALDTEGNIWSWGNSQGGEKGFTVGTINLHQVKLQGKTEKINTVYNQEIESKYEIEKNDLIVKLNNIETYQKVEVNIIGKNIEIETISVINEEIEGILEDLEIETILKEKIDTIIFSELPINKKRIRLRKLKKEGLEPKFINMFIGLLEFIETK